MGTSLADIWATHFSEIDHTYELDRDLELSGQAAGVGQNLFRGL